MELHLASDVVRGENAGRRLKHSAVVRRLNSIHKVKAGEAFSSSPVISLEKSWKPENVRAIVFVQKLDGLASRVLHRFVEIRVQADRDPVVTRFSERVLHWRPHRQARVAGLEDREPVRRAQCPACWAGPACRGLVLG